MTMLESHIKMVVTALTELTVVEAPSTQPTISCTRCATAAGRIIDRPNSCSGAALSIMIAVENFWKVQLAR